jgi:hypothetical protein
MADIAFPLSTSPGQRPQEGMGRLINAYAETRGEGKAVWHRAPGVRILGADTASATWTAWSFPYEEWFSVRETPAGAGQYRGGTVVSSNVYGVFGTSAYTVDESGAFTLLTNGSASVAGTDKIWAFRNNNATPQIVFVTAAGVFQTTGTTMVSFADSDVGSPSCGCFHDGYFMFGYGSGRIQASGVNTLAVNPLDFTTAETNPDGVIDIFSYRGNLYVMGTATIEVYGQPINPEGFPLTRVDYNITPGLISPHCVAGYEPEFGNNPIYCASDNTVRQLNGFTPDKISPPELDALIAAVSDKSTLEAMCYVTKGHAFWQLSCDTWTWTYNCNNQKWHERRSDGLVRSRMSISLPAFNKWLCGDTESSYFLHIDGALTTEVNEEILYRIESVPTKGFPNRVRVNRADFDFVVGVGDATGSDPVETDPSILVSWSDDGGFTWTNPWYRKLGRQAEAQQRVTVLNTGLSGPMGRRWRLDISDPVHAGLMGAAFDGGAVSH